MSFEAQKQLGDRHRLGKLAKVQEHSALVNANTLQTWRARLRENHVENVVSKRAVPLMMDDSGIAPHSAAAGPARSTSRSPLRKPYRLDNSLVYTMLEVEAMELHLKEGTQARKPIPSPVRPAAHTLAYNPLAQVGGYTSRDAYNGCNVLWEQPSAPGMIHVKHTWSPGYRNALARLNVHDKDKQTAIIRAAIKKAERVALSQAAGGAPPYPNWGAAAGGSAQRGARPGPGFAPRKGARLAHVHWEEGEVEEEEGPEWKYEEEQQAEEELVAGGGAWGAAPGGLNLDSDLNSNDQASRALAAALALQEAALGGGLGLAPAPDPSAVSAAVDALLDAPADLVREDRAKVAEEQEEESEEEEEEEGFVVVERGDAVPPADGCADHKTAVPATAGPSALAAGAGHTDSPTSSPALGPHLTLDAPTSLASLPTPTPGDAPAPTPVAPSLCDLDFMLALQEQHVLQLAHQMQAGAGHGPDGLEGLCAPPSPSPSSFPAATYTIDLGQLVKHGRVRQAKRRGRGKAAGLPDAGAAGVSGQEVATAAELLGHKEEEAIEVPGQPAAAVAATPATLATLATPSSDRRYGCMKQGRELQALDGGSSQEAYEVRPPPQADSQEAYEVRPPPQADSDAAADEVALADGEETYVLV